MRQTSEGLFKNFKKKTKETQEHTDQFILFVSKNMDGRTFTIFNQRLSELRSDVLYNKTHTLQPDSFLIFLDKLRTLTHSEHINDLIIAKLEKVDLDAVKSRDLLECYQENSIDFKFEESLREGEIKQFADSVMPKANFIFDNYKVHTDMMADSAASSEQLESLSEPEEPSDQLPQTHYPDGEQNEDDFFSFFSSHEKIIMKPESSFAGLRSFLTTLPVDYYILLQQDFE
jgi:hypothetical protein